MRERENKDRALVRERERGYRAQKDRQGGAEQEDSNREGKRRGNE